MGLGPSVCENCLLFANYHPNKENPGRQGDWLCPQCGFECGGSLFMYPKALRDEITIRTEIIKENKGI